MARCEAINITIADAGQKGRRNMSLKWLSGATMVLAFWLSANAQASVSPGPVTLQAHDGVSVSGLVYEARQPKGIILLFHQAGSSKAEYATIAPGLAAAGFTALAIDQRSGGTLYGPNETVSRLRQARNTRGRQGRSGGSSRLGAAAPSADHIVGEQLLGGACLRGRRRASESG
jgi:hypothetical protein